MLRTLIALHRAAPLMLLAACSPSGSSNTSESAPSSAEQSALPSAEQSALPSAEHSAAPSAEHSAARGQQAQIAPAAGESESTACPSGSSGCDHGSAADRRAPLRVAEDGTRIFGAELDSERPLVELAELAESPRQFEGQRIRTTGTVHRVCQRMGCWIELVNPEGTQVRVPMAGHAFFLPTDVQGRSAEVDGTVRVAALSPEQRAHLESEGALATATELAIDAHAVAIH